jgi:hypothetical protein
MRRAVALIALLSLSVLAGAAPVDDADPPERAPDPVIAPDQDFDRTRFTIRVSRNGSARWIFRYMRYLPDDESVAEFRTYADRFEGEETQLYRDFEDRATALTRIGRNQTGRSMAAEAFSRRAFVDRGVNDVGVVQVSFRWVAFAVVERPRVVVGDVFEGGLFLGPDQSLVVQPGPDLAFESVAPNGTTSSGTLVESDSVTWQGEREFPDGRPRIVFVVPSAIDETPTDDTPGTPVTVTPTTGTSRSTVPGGSDDSDDGSDRTTSGATDPDSGTETSTAGPASGADGGFPFALVIGALVLIVGLIGGLAYRHTATDSPDESERPTDPTPPVEPTDATDVDQAVPDSAILSDEERVVKLLEENGGRMRQVNIVDETDWSKSKVSMLLSDMEEAGTISKLRVGRENIVSLAGHEPEAAGSPFEDLDDDPDEDG